MNPVTNLMMNGYMGMQLLEFVMRQFPQSRKKIELALQQGYSPEQVGTYVEKEFAGKADTKAKRRLEKNISGTPTDAQASRVKELRSKREEKLAKTVGGIGLAAAALPIASAAIRGGMLGRGAQTVAGRLGQLPPGPNNPPGSMPLPGAGPKGPMGGAPQGGAGGPVGAMGGIPTTQIMQAYAQHLAKGGKLSLDSFMRTAMGVMAGKGGQAKPGANPAAQQPEGPIDVTGEVQVTTPGQPTAPMPMQQPAPANAAPMQAQEQPIEQAPTPEQQQAQKEQEADTILDAMKLKPTIEKMLKAGNQPDVIADLIGFKMTPGEKAWVKEQGVDTPSLVKSYADKVIAEQGQGPTEDQKLGSMVNPLPNEGVPQKNENQPQAALDQSAESNDMIENEPEEPKPLTAGASVMLPNGDLGKVTEVDGRKVSLDVDGKKKQAPIEHALRPSDHALEYTEQEVENIISKIPESDRSTAFYVYQPLGDGLVWVELTSNAGDGYLYENVPDELSEQILSASTAPKTTGENLFGVYSQKVADSRGSPFTELRSNPDKYPFRKVKKGYDLLQMFKTSATEQNKKREKEKRAAKSAEKKASKVNK